MRFAGQMPLHEAPACARIYCCLAASVSDCLHPGLAQGSQLADRAQQQFTGSGLYTCALRIRAGVIVVRWPEQKRIFRQLPGLGEAVFARFGSIHRNTYVNAPVQLDERLQLRARPGVHLAGQMAGVEGYVESAALGYLVGVDVAREVWGEL